MNIVFIGKNDTWGIMLAWKQLIPDNIKYFMSHPAVPYEDLSEFNKDLRESLDKADIIFAHVAMRDRGYPDVLEFNGIKLDKYVNKTIIYFCGTAISQTILNSYLSYYKKFKNIITSNTIMSSLYDIPYAPIPLDFSKTLPNYWKINEEKQCMSISRLGGQWETSMDEIIDFKELGNYFADKFEGTEFISKPLTKYNDIIKYFYKHNIAIYFDTKIGNFSGCVLNSAWAGLCSISSIYPEFVKPMIDFTGTWTLPFINVTNYSEMKREFESLLSYPEFILDEGMRARRWMEKYWSRERHVNNLYKIIGRIV